MTRIWGAVEPIRGLGAFLVLGICVMSCAALPPGLAAPSAEPPKSRLAAAPEQAVANLDGPWRFQVGDDSRWAEPDFDDSGWRTVVTGKPLTEQGFDAYTGYAWYRLRVTQEQRAQLGSQPLALQLSSFGIGQLEVYLNGAEGGHTRGLTATDGFTTKPVPYQSLPFSVPVPAAVLQSGSDGGLVIAIRSWAAIPVTHGPLGSAVLGSRELMAEKEELATARRWASSPLVTLMLSGLFLSVAVLGTTLYLSQRNHSEYLWLAILCMTVATTGVSESLWGLEEISYPVFMIFSLWTGRLFMAATLEFVRRFTASSQRRFVHSFQVVLLLSPFLQLLHLQVTYEYVTLGSQIVFCIYVSYLLFRGWRRGLPEAGVMLLPFFLAATADSIDTVLDYAASRHWIAARFAAHQFHLGPMQVAASSLAFLLFLASLLAVILYRFVHVSQAEQRSAAEIEAARSVQALLIPTQLPSSRSFSLDSAYLPMNGVGGDFFQVLPLKDDSMLVVVGDVSGKGLQAAMNASSLVGALRNEPSHNPATVLEHLNQVMLGATSGAIAAFATCLCARIYPNGEMTIANAGHLSPYRDGREMELAACLPLGIVPGMEYEQMTVQLKQGDRLIFLSDGVVEAANGKGELFGFERTQQVSHESARFIAQTAQRFGQTDDITVVSVYFVPA